MFKISRSQRYFVGLLVLEFILILCIRWIIRKPLESVNLDNQSVEVNVSSSVDGNRQQLQHPDINLTAIMSGEIQLPEFKYFHEAPFKLHVDARFDTTKTSNMVRIVNIQEESTYRLERLRALFKAWTEFTSKHGIEAWIAHGTLLGWYWGKKIQTFDDDIDVQMRLEEFVKLIPFNKTMISDTALLDINPHFVNRTIVKDCLNMIDARVIDTASGYFIDITAVIPENITTWDGFGHGNTTLTWICKSPWRFKDEHIFPLVHVELDGCSTFRPYNTEALLEQEYRHWKSPSMYIYKGMYHYDQKQKRWIAKPRGRRIQEQFKPLKLTDDPVSRKM
ncbi:LicD family-domain-containing protein [Polychytrium aggregatum]|uniref:LicD family-domain-containing protein n=1 Tax=Polychytrium aggregatum TaxID=110093 RepID=UPI0022FF2956|nr:LicD family-domain-containing protein [Polychytrium aggregatum]KAI9203401.1 LicD family-domain-containing protein [Polychytrium aggregatum]